jgi:YD repeat-containing protein
MDKETRYYHKNSDFVAYKRIKDSNGDWRVYTFNEQGRKLTYEDSDGYSCKYTYDENGNRLTYEDSNGYYEIRGRQVSKEEFEKFINPKPYVGKKVVVDDVEYILN